MVVSVDTTALSKRTRAISGRSAGALSDMERWQITLLSDLLTVQLKQLEETRALRCDQGDTQRLLKEVLKVLSLC